MKIWSRPVSGPIKIAGLLTASAVVSPVFGQETAAAEAPAARVVPPTIDSGALNSMRIGVDTVWVLATAMLVFWMNVGFALVESVLRRSKNCVNISTKHVIVLAAKASM
jgi:Amt family ammonium transporter